MLPDIAPHLSLDGEYSESIDVLERTTSHHLLDTERRLRLFVDSVNDYALLMLDAQGKVVSWHAGARNLKGYTADEIIGKHFSCFYPIEDVVAGKPDLQLRVAARTGRFEDVGIQIGRAHV